MFSIGPPLASGCSIRRSHRSYISGMQRAKTAIKEMFQNKEELYKLYTSIIQARWDKHLKNQLHATAYLLNHAFFYNVELATRNKLMQYLIDVLEAHSNDDMDRYVTMMQQIIVYHDRKESFNKVSCEKAAQKLNPYERWIYYGGSIPKLQQITIRLLSQTSSSSSCERNWSLFERIHTKRRNRLEHQMLNDLVFTNYNMRDTLAKKKESYDLIDFESIDKVDFWVVEDDPTLEFDNPDMAHFELEEITRNYEGDEYVAILEPPCLNADDNVGPSAFGFPPSATPPDVAMPADLDVVNEDYGVN